jgi:hypothetical protein
VTTTTVPKKTVIHLPCPSIVALVRPGDRELQRFLVSQKCASSEAIRSEAVIPTSLGTAVREVKLAFSTSPTDITVELRNMPRGTFSEQQYGEASIRQPFAETESFTWKVRYSNEIVFSFIPQKFAHIRTIIDLFIALSSMNDRILAVSTPYPLEANGGHAGVVDGAWDRDSQGNPSAAAPSG